MHNVGLVQDTLFRRVPSPGAYAAVAHCVPSQCNMSGAMVEPLCEKPTAAQNVALTHDTPCNRLRAASGAGLGTTVQALPFQCSVSVCGGEYGPAVPTAKQLDELMHDTERRSP
jgi:hypothetical protein